VKSAACAVVIVATIASGDARADDPIAATAYNQATELERQGKWAEACPLYETSYHADPQIGVLLHLAICHEQIGRLASAWSEFTDAADLAHSRNDPREATARARASALAPRLAKLYLAPPSKPIAGMVVRRDGVEITALVGTNMPIDPGDHEIVVSAPGYVAWTHAVKITGQDTTAVDIPLLEAAPVVAAKPHEGRLVITTRPDAEILLDTQHVAVGRYDAKVATGGHTLRVVAPGMRAYQVEVLVSEDRDRVIDVPLEPELIVAPPEDNPAFELGASLESGVKLHGDKPAVVALRAEAAFRFGRRVNFGLFAELGSISTGNACGTSMPGAIPSTPYDFGPRNQFTSCSYVMSGLQLYIHVLPKQTFDPYLGIAPAFRFGFVDWTPYVNGEAQMPKSDVFPAIVVGARAGLDYHPKADFAAWEVGAFFEASITAFGQEDAHDSGNNSSGETYVSLLGGLRSTVAF
jgi:hypothetical protein